ncbi:MAG: saccharopine dehydrogenase NADP-binding domain-containing protein, partial [Planctomycetota bacterium]|nr:saccharopine dehydrogenase NADP-binding domain-containing protein [Planctomycetota bacterium]
MTTPNWMIYGATGYTGELIAQEAKRRGLAPILAGRNRQRIEALGRELDLPTRVVGLEESAALERSLQDLDLVLHCAGPFVRTSPPMLEACLTTGTHYLDITGEIAVFESVLSLDEEARAAGVALLPGVGFDVVPTDCLAASLAEALTDATHLELAFIASGGSLSRGTLKTMIEAIPDAGAVRENGKITPVPLAFDAKVIEFSCGKRWAMTIPWGDVSTAFHSTGIPNIRVYSGQSPRAIRRARRMRPLLPLAGLKPVKRFLQWRVDRTVTGPDQTTRDSARTFIWGTVVNAAGERVTGTLEAPEGYAFTVLSSVECARRVLDGAVAPGAWTPSRAFGSGFVGELPGVSVGELTRS